MISAIGAFTIERFENLSHLLGLFWQTFRTIARQFLRLRFRFKESREQMYLIGVESVPIIGFSLTFVSLMLILEFSFHMKLVLHQDSLVPAFSTVLMLREVGPVISCLLLVSRVGAGIAAEIGSMKTTEQLDALKLLSIDPIEYLILPRWFGCVFAAISLSIISISIAIAAGVSIASVSLGYLPREFFNTMFTFTRFEDMTSCIIKAAVFGSIIPIVAAHHGFRCRMGSDGVGDAATSAVVQGSILIIIADFVLTYWLYAL